MSEFPDSTTSTKSLSEAETETFCPETDISSDDEEVTAFEKEYSCAICRVPNNFSIALSQSVLESGGSFHIVRNIVWLRCHICRNLYHLKCISTYFTLEDILFIIEQDYTCRNCDS